MATQYYDWTKAFSYNADVTLVIASRGRGKTYGLRLQCMQDALKRGYRWVEICRHQKELPEVMQGYFERLSARDEFADIEFKTEGRRGYMRRPGAKEWTCINYFVALTDAQAAKKRTYMNVKRMIFDEALIEPGTYQRYLQREWQVLANIVDTLTRESIGGGGVRPHLYMCANSVDLINPYFIAWGIDAPPEFGFSWHMGKRVLLHYEDPGEYAQRKAEETLAGRMASLSEECVTSLENRFRVSDTDDITQKTSNAKFWIGLVYRGARFGVWVDWSAGYYYVNRRIPDGADIVFALTREDNTLNRLIARRASPSLRALASGYYDRLMRFDSVSTRESFLDALQMVGIL